MLCPKCSRSPLPFVMVILIASVLAFTTWLTLSLSQLESMHRLAAAVLVFIAVGGTLLHYVIRCLQRHCRHDRAHRHDHTHREPPDRSLGRPA